MLDEQDFPLYSVWERDYDENYWVVFYVCETCDTIGRGIGRRVARVLAARLRAYSVHSSRRHVSLRSIMAVR